MTVLSTCISTLLVAAILYGSPALASGTEAGHCTDCFVETPNGLRMKDNLTFVASVLDDINDKYNWGPSCINYATGTKIGEWGHAIRKEYMAGNFTHLAEGTPDIHQLCPNYKIMKPTDKANFWVLIFNAMTHYESTCNPKATAKGPNGSLYGLMQLHVGREQVYAKSCEKGDSKTPVNTFACTLDMLNGQLRRDNALFSRKSYWDVLRPQAASGKAKKISRSVSAYVPCHDEKRLNVKQAEFFDNEEVWKALQISDTPDDGAWDG
ncbi:hypothetical protein ACNQKP_17800 [Bdellovibrio bacteriovorus]|uniref:hypothetical protein n=1 Tax=Bdellovibrio bacteriovorus TaxID=959 RepID=UPI003AA8E09F